MIRNIARYHLSLFHKVYVLFLIRSFSKREEQSKSQEDQRFTRKVIFWQNYRVEMHKIRTNCVLAWSKDTKRSIKPSAFVTIAESVLKNSFYSEN